MKLGGELRSSRNRRRLTQAALAKTVGISRQRLGALELGRGAAAPSEVWVALAGALGRYLKFEFARDPRAELADAGHLQTRDAYSGLGPGRLEGWVRAVDAAAVSASRSAPPRVQLLCETWRRHRVEDRLPALLARPYDAALVHRDGDAVGTDQVSELLLGQPGR